MQLKAGIKKEWMEFFYTKRWLGFFLPLLFFIIMDPLMMMVMPKMLAMMPAELGLESLTAIYTSSQVLAMQSFCGDFSQMGMLALLLVLMKTAGGDQKNKSCVIPICNGFRRSTYILAKFVVYPAIALVGTMIAYLLTYGFSWFLFEEKLAFVKILLPMLGLGCFSAFIASLMLMFGCMTGKGGISAILIFIAVTFIPSILSILKINRYNPLALTSYAVSYDKLDALEYWITLLITVAAGVLFYLLTASVFQRKKLA